MAAGSNIDITFADIVAARDAKSPEFADLVCEYVERRDPAQNRPEEPTTDEFPELPDDAWTVAKLRGAISAHGLWGKTDSEAWATRRAAWQSLMAAPHPPPRLRLGDMMIELYEVGDRFSRQALIDIFARAKLGWGLWKGFKSIFKLAEERHDAEMFGVLAMRADILKRTKTTHEISGATALYMQRRAWRYLRELGGALPELFPTFACQALRHYPEGIEFYGTRVAGQIVNRKALLGDSSVAYFAGPPKETEKRAFDDAWKVDPDPLLRLLEDAKNNHVCQFAINCLRADFDERLRNIEAPWLARLANKRLTSTDELIVDLIESSPTFHQSKLEALGLESTVVGLLRSRSAKAVRFAIDYCNAQSPAIDIEMLLELAKRSGDDLAAFVKARVEKIPAREFGLPRLVRMLGISALFDLAKAKIGSAYRAEDFDVESYVTLALGDSQQKKFVAGIFTDAKLQVPTEFLRALAEKAHQNPRGRRLVRSVLTELGKRSASEIGVDWIVEKLFDPHLGNSIGSWLRQGMLKGDELDADWLKGLVRRPTKRALALELLGNQSLIAPHRIGSTWLLGAARHSDTAVAEFAQSYLLTHFSPSDFALEHGLDDPARGAEFVYALLGDDQPAVRRFAVTYLLAHHPEVSKRLPNGPVGVEPKLTHTDYGPEVIEPLLANDRIEVREFAARIVRTEIVRWNRPEIAYRLASSTYSEARAIGGEALLAIGEPPSESEIGAPLAWLDPVRAFAMAESPHKSTREVALSLVQKHYSEIGSAEKLASLMDSPDREVRLFAVRLLWEKHRPMVGAASERERFDSAETLREFMRTVLFGLPPGRMERRDGPSAAQKPYPASVAKKRIIEVVRDMAVLDVEFAAIATPVFEEFLASAAKGEWHSCASALARLRAAHPTIAVNLPEAQAL